MSENVHKPHLTSSEIASLWTQYQNDSMAICVSRHMINTVDDPYIKELLEFALSLSQKHVKIIKSYLTEENFPIPIGFTEADVNLDAPRLFSDELCLQYHYIMSVNGMTGYSLALGTSHREDVRKYYLSCLNDATELFNRSVDLVLKKGLVRRPPYIHPADQPEFVQSQKFLAGFFAEHRPLTAVEISHVHFDIRKLDLSKAFTLGCAQVAQSQKVRELFLRGAEIYTKQIEVLESILKSNNLEVPQSESSEVTTSRVAPFSDKLMMFHKGVFSSTSIAVFGASIGVTLRRDVAATYSRLMTEMMKYSEDTANLMIDNGWLEKAPCAPDREKIIRQRDS